MCVLKKTKCTCVPETNFNNEQVQDDILNLRVGIWDIVKGIFHRQLGRAMMCVLPCSTMWGWYHPLTLVMLDLPSEVWTHWMHLTFKQI